MSAPAHGEFAQPRLQGAGILGNEHFKPAPERTSLFALHIFWLANQETYGRLERIGALTVENRRKMASWEQNELEQSEGDRDNDGVGSTGTTATTPTDSERQRRQERHSKHEAVPPAAEMGGDRDGSDQDGDDPYGRQPERRRRQRRRRQQRWAGAGAETGAATGGSIKAGSVAPKTYQGRPNGLELLGRVSDPAGRRGPVPS
jgi:hypothetical protein